MRAPQVIIEASTKAIIKAERMLGSENALAKEIGVSRQNISYWRMSNTLLPFDKAGEIYVATNGRVKLIELRPDLKVLIDRMIILILKQYNHLLNR